MWCSYPKDTIGANRVNKEVFLTELTESTAKQELPACPVETTLTLISDKWKVLILRDLMNGTLRFGELKKSIGHVTQKVLTAQLRQMEASGLLTRKVYAEVPPRVQEKKSLWRRSKKKNGLAPCFFPGKGEKTPIPAVARKKGLCYDKATFRRCRKGKFPTEGRKGPYPMNILIIGCGKVGSRLAGFLSRRGHAVSIVDRSPWAFDRLDDDFTGYTVEGIPLDGDVLKEAGIEGCDILVAVTNDDNINLMVGQMAREIFQLQELPEKPYLQELLILQPRQSFPESRCALRTRQSFRRSLEIPISVRRKSRKPSIPWYP